MTEIVLQPDAGVGKDCRVYSGTQAAKNYGIAPTFVSGRDNLSQTIRGLIEFDLSSIPLGATVDSAVLTLYMSNNIDSTGARNVDIHRITQAWNEGAQNAVIANPGECSWDDYASPNAWASGGGDFDATQDATKSVNAVGFYTWDIKTLVQEWVDGTANEGLLIKDDNETGTNTRKIFNLSDHATAGQRPKLVINYTPSYTPQVMIF